MQIPPSKWFSPAPLAGLFNADRAMLDGGLAPQQGDYPDWSLRDAFGEVAFQGIPFSLGQPGEPNVLLLEPEGGELRIELEPVCASYIVFLHAAEDRSKALPAGFGVPGVAPVRHGGSGHLLGDHVSDYTLIYDDGETATTAIRRRFAIQQRHADWGVMPFEAVSARGSAVFTTATEDHYLGRAAWLPYGEGETRHDGQWPFDDESLWLYALPNPHPDRPIAAITLTPGPDRSVIYGISTTELTGHPLRPGVRRKLRLTLPEGVELITPGQPGTLGEIDVDQRDPRIAIDLGTVISARASLAYDHARWLGNEPEVQPEPSTREVTVEYAAHPNARLYLKRGDEWLGVDLPSANASDGDLAIVEVGVANRLVRVRMIDKTTRQPIAVRLHIHGAAGEYLPPRGRHRKVNAGWFEDNYGEFVNDHNQYSYLLGDCEVDLPLGTVYVEISRGFEYAPIRTAVEITPETGELTFELERTLFWRERGWVTADTHVHFLSPQTALLEGSAEGVNVVNLLASQWGEMYSNVSDFDGRTTIGAKEFGGDGEFLVRVGTENRMNVLGHISLLGYSGSMIHPLCTAGPPESAIGDPLESSMAEWAQRCIDQGGLVVMPHAPNPQCERAADIELGLINAIEMMTFNPHWAQLNPYGLADWYRYLNIGHQVPLCGGSDKMSAAFLLGGVRTYAQLGELEFTYENWMAAVRGGNTFVTVGPLVELLVDGKPAGSKIALPASGGAVDVTWRVESNRVPIEQVELVVGGLVAEQQDVGGAYATSGMASVRVTDSTWIALRVRGSLRARPGDIAAHTSAIQALVGDKPIFSHPDALAVLEQIEGSLAFVDTIAPRPEAQRYRQLRSSLEAAHNRLHNRMHAQGVFHRHTPTEHHPEHNG